MSNYETSASIVLEVNGKNAEARLKALRQRAEDLENALARARSSGDKIEMNKLQKELRKANKEIKEMSSSAQQAENVMRRLDRATPKELSKTLSTLRRQLDNIERGSAAWNAQVEKIKLVQRELNSVKNSMREHESLWTRFSKKMFDWGNAITMSVAAISGLTMSGRKAVQSYADMEGEMASVRKFTGMTMDEVEKLNESFKTMDTRSSREQLNKLAQEAGMLGLASQDAVLEYVKAADVINVALDELGEGATRDIGKLSSIYGDADRMGLGKAMLAVGAAINEVSQNSTASASYLVDFENRMAGVGKQADMTVAQIMGYASVLDQNAQQVEMSATALQGVIMKMYKEPEKLARIAGINVKQFAQMVKEDANEALLYFLDTLGRAGGMQELAPMFDAMKLDGARAASVLSVLAGNIESVRREQKLAQEAFDEGTSAITEFNVQNNTVQAQLDKAKKSFNEISIALGKDLLPVMRYSITSASAMLRVLKFVVDFLKENRTLIISLTAGVAGYTVAVKAGIIAQKLWNATQKTGNAIALVSRGTIQLLRLSYYRLTGQIRKADVVSKAFNRTTKMSPVGILVGALAAGVGALLSYMDRMKSAREEAAEAAKAEREFERSITDVSEATASASKAELAQLRALYQAAVNEANSKEERIKAAKRLQAMYPDYFAKMSTEQILLGEAKSKYDDLTESILKNAKAKAAADLIKKNSEQIIEIEQSIPELKKNISDANAAYNQAKQRRKEYIEKYTIHPTEMVGGPVQDQSAILSNFVNKATAPGTDSEKAAVEDAKKVYADANKKLEKLQAANKKLAEEYGVSSIDVFAGQGPGGVTIGAPGGSIGDTGSGTKNKFQAEDDWLALEQSKTLASYATGLIDYTQYNEKKAELDKQYLLKKLQNTEATEQEIAEITGELNKLTEKEVTQRNKEQLDAAKEEIEAERWERDAAITDSYMRSQISEKTYQQMKFESEVVYLNRLKELYAEGSQERAEIEKQITDKLQADKLAKFKETQDLQKSLYEEYFKGISLMSDEEREQQYRMQIDALDTLTKKMLETAGSDEAKRQKIVEASAIAEKALKKQYLEETTEESFNAMEKANAELAEWLQSDGGRAVTDSFGTIMSGMSAIFSQISSIVQSNLEMETAAIENRYDKEISLAEGNTYKVKKIEQDKEKAIAKAKNEANRKMFAMQVIQAIAQTAQNAIAAYGSAAAIPLVGYIMAPIAAGLAVAAGAVQIAAIKKQQQASEAQGYAVGGFTRPGPVNEPAGIVHAGEWVASQKLVTSPVTRPIIDALEYAQRTNTIGSISRVSTPPGTISLPTTSPDGGGNSPDTGVLLATYFAVLKKLNDRLDEPFITVNTVTGDRGIKKAQDEYDRLIRNKTPKSRRK
ncbi:phage tail tape measure protein [Barnesiella sp. An55]|uniref:phage tail tape measure protein n=1 Tax=Barnesiella sp. An55 TaxID=1965646 RepID=UPI000B383FF9|nr:phage tail tape measure protein [Barnesiella sp. An55]OUN70225.1 phage tail tape measure protein [Barnesiella sp. An55]